MGLKKTVVLLSVILFILLMIVNFVNSANDIIVNEPQPEKKEGWFSKYFGFIYSPIFWGAMVFIVLFFIILLGIVFFIRWLVKFIKLRNDIYYRARSDRMKLARIHKTYPSKHWLKVSKNTPIRLVKLVNNKPYISSPIGYHKGDYMSHDGNFNISMNLIGDKHFFIFPKASLLVIPDRDSFKINSRDDKGKLKEIEIKDLPRVDKIVQLTANDILLYCESISNIGLFHFPVLKAVDGKILDLSMPIYKSLKDIAVSEYLYEQSDEFVKVNKKAIDMNPNIRGTQKINDSSGNVEIPRNDGGNQ